MPRTGNTQQVNLAAQAVSPGKFEIVEAPMPEPDDGEALVRYDVASICGSDLHIAFMGWNVDSWPLPPGYPGHEGVGTVIDSRSENLQAGDRVLAVPHIWNSFGFARFQAVDDGHLMKLPSTGDAGALSLTQQLGTVIYAAKRLPQMLGATAVVLGQGSAGLFWDHTLARLGLGRIITVEPLEHRRDLGATYGVTNTVDVIGQAATDAVMDLTDGRGADLVIEAVGSTPTLSQAFHLVRDEGQVVLFGLPEKSGEVPFDFDTWFRKRASAYTRLGSQDEPGLASYAQALDWIVTGQIDVSPIISHRFPGERTQEAFDLAMNRDNGVVKIALEF
jgi:L-iditol 2-dehydrogenase